MFMEIFPSKYHDVDKNLTYLNFFKIFILITIKI